LLTHLNEADFTRALFWYIDATAPMGILIVTIHGRRTANLMRHNAAFRAAIEAYERTGFGFALTHHEQSEGLTVEYGGCLTKPFWLFRLVETHPDVRILGFYEAAWDNNHDVIILQKHPI
jgi:hypothetical protein